MTLEAIAFVYCDSRLSDDCEKEIEVELTELAGGGWDARNVPARLKKYKWTIVGDEHICEACSEVHNADNQ